VVNYSQRSSVPFLLVVITLASACQSSAGDTATQSGVPTHSAAVSFASPSQNSQAVATPEYLGDAEEITEEGFYVFEPTTGSLWRVDASFGASGAWSPDGREFLRFGPERSNVDVIDLSTTSARRIFSGAFWHFSWSPVGDQIVLATPEGLYTLGTDEAEPARLSPLDGRGGLGWSPRGDRIASSDRYEVLVTDVSTGESTIVSPDTAPGDYLGFSFWMPDGRTLVFCSSPSTGTEVFTVAAGAYLYDLADGSTRKLADNCGVLPSPDGLSYAYSDGTAVFVASFGGTEPARRMAEGYDLGGWLPDGSALALDHKSCLTGDHDIYSAAADNGEVRRATYSPDVYKESAGWSPVANQLAYSAILSDRQALILLDVETGESNELLTSARDFHIHGPKWSPDGRFISFTAGSGHGAC
jgi:Tol biopolymer transport system component